MNCVNCDGRLVKIGDHQEFESHSIFQCDNCKLIQTNPIISPSYLNEYYKKTFRANRLDQKLNIKYILEKKKIAQSQFLYISKNSGIIFEKNTNILEIGCSIGALLEKFHKLGCNVQGIEPDIQMANFAIKSGLNVKNTSFDANLFSGTKFDLIILSHVFEHLPVINTFFNDIKKILNEKGVLFIEVPNDNLEKVKKMIDLHFTSSHLYFYNPISLKDVFIKNNFSILKINTVGINLSKQIERMDYLIKFKNGNLNIFNKIIIIIKSIWMRIFTTGDIYSRKINHDKFIYDDDSGVALRILGILNH